MQALSDLQSRGSRLASLSSKRIRRKAVVIEVSRLGAGVLEVEEFAVGATRWLCFLPTKELIRGPG